MNSNPFKSGKELEVTEDRVIHRITFPRVIDSIVDAFNLDRGLVYTLRRLFTVPGKLVADYLYEGRHHYTPPFRMLIVSTTLVVLLINYSSTGFDVLQVRPEGATDEQAQMAMDMMTNYYNLLIWPFIPIMALFTWLFNRRSGYNYAENVVYQTYFSVIGNLLYVLMLLDRWVDPSILTSIYMVMSITYSAIGYRQFFGKSVARSILEFIAVLLLSFIVYMPVLVSLMGAIMALKMTSGG